MTTSWVTLEGPGLAKAESLFGYPGHVFLAFAQKLRGKTIFAREHGGTTLYVVGNAGHAYSMKLPGGAESATLDDLNQLVDTARTGDLLKYPKSGIYRNMEVS